MATIESSISLYDNFSPVLNNVMAAMNLTIASVRDMQTSMGGAIDTSTFEAAENAIHQAGAAMESLNQQMQAANGNMSIESNPLNLGTDQVTTELGQLRTQISGAEEAQNDLNNAVMRMDVNSVNQDYRRLSDTVGNTEHYLRDNVDEQGRFNNEVEDATSGMNILEGAVQKVVTAIGGMFAIQKVVGWIKECTSAADTQLNAETQLATTLANMGGDRKSYDAIVKKAQDIQAAGMYGDEAMIGAAAEFATYMNDTTALEMMMDTLANYAAGMSGGGAIDYNSMVDYAANLGKITTGAYDAMTKKGFEFTDAQKAVIDGTATQSQYVKVLGKDWQSMSEDMRSATVISEIINESWGDLYSTMSNTPQAQLISLKNTLGDIQEEVGNRLYNSLGVLFSTIADNTPMIREYELAIANGLNVVIAVLARLIQGLAYGAGFVKDNWSVIGPVFYGVAAALAFLTIAAGINAIAMKVQALATGRATLALNIHKAALERQMGATFGATVKQYGFNAALLACPITWVVLGIIAIIAAIGIATAVINKICGTTISAGGMIAGTIFYIMGAITNCGLLLANIFHGSVAAATATGHNIMEAFKVAISKVKSMFYSLASTVLGVIGAIAEDLSRLPFVEFDASGLGAKANEYAAKAKKASGYEGDYQDIGAAWDSGFNTYEYLDLDAEFDRGYEWGKGLQDKLSGLVDFSDIDNPLDGINPDDYLQKLDTAGDNSGKAAKGATDTAKNTEKLLDITDEELKYLRDIKERQIIDRTVFRDIHIDMSGAQNIVKNEADLDGICSKMAKKLSDQIKITMEGVG